MLARKVDASLAGFLGMIAKVVMIAFVVIITLGNFGISISPLIALAGASAFGATVALQGPLSNYGAGLSIILGQPLVVGNTDHGQERERHRRAGDPCQHGADRRRRRAHPSAE